MVLVGIVQGPHFLMERYVMMVMLVLTQISVPVEHVPEGHQLHVLTTVTYAMVQSFVILSQAANQDLHLL